MNGSPAERNTDIRTTIPDVSICIPAYNEELLLGKCLETLNSQQTAYTYEIIVIDNASTDNTASIAASFKNVRVISEKRKGYIYAFLKGISQARAPIIAITDADTTHGRHWMEFLMKQFENPEVVCVGGPCYFSDKSSLLKYGNTLLMKFQKVTGTLSPIGANIAFRKHAYEKIGGLSTAVNLQSDRYLARQLKRVGTVKWCWDLKVYMSGRRFHSPIRLIREVIIRFINVIWIMIFNRTVFWSFDDIRE